MRQPITSRYFNLHHYSPAHKSGNDGLNGFDEDARTIFSGNKLQKFSKNVAISHKTPKKLNEILLDNNMIFKKFSEKSLIYRVGTLYEVISGHLKLYLGAKF